MFFPSGGGSVTLPAERTPQESLETLKDSPSVEKIWSRGEGRNNLGGFSATLQGEGDGGVFNLRTPTRAMR